MIKKTQIAIIGGGPAGSTAAILLAKAGLEVMLFERERHPRYHIGESGILTLPIILDLLNVKERVEALGTKKKGGVFFDWNERWLVNWGESGQYTYHVIRSEFDHLLLTRARECKAQIFEEASVTAVHFEGSKPTELTYEQNGKKFEVGFDYLIDASGQCAFLARRYFKSQIPLEAFKNVALWGYWIKANSPHSLKGFQGLKGYETDIENPIVVSSIPHGWIWGIPLHDQTLSVGVVLSQRYFNEVKKEKSLAEFYSDSIKKSEVFESLLKPAYLVSSIRRAQDWSYYTSNWAGEGYFLVGDAAVFIDPLLSTGMTSAMISSLSAAACIIELYKKELDPSKIIDFYRDDYQKRFWRLSFVIGALYGAKGHQEDLFYKTHSLTSNDLSGTAYDEIKQSFSSVISGMEDLKELKAFDLQKIAAARLRENFKDFVGIIPKLPDLTPHDLELTFSPIGLRESTFIAKKKLKKRVFTTLT